MGGVGSVRVDYAWLWSMWASLFSMLLLERESTREKDGVIHGADSLLTVPYSRLLLVNARLRIRKGTRLARHSSASPLEGHARSYCMHSRRVSLPTEDCIYFESLLGS